MSKWEETYLKIQKDVLGENDFYNMKNEDGEQIRGLGQDGTYKLAAEHEFTTEIKQENVVENGEYKRWEFTIAVYDKDGKHQLDEVGSCDTAEKLEWTNHAIRSFAYTRTWMHGIKRASYVMERLVDDIQPAKKHADPASPTGQAAAQLAKTKTGKPESTTPTAHDSPPKGPTGCECEIEDVENPHKVDGVFLCGKCELPISKPKRIQHMISQKE